MMTRAPRTSPIPIFKADTQQMQQQQHLLTFSLYRL